MDCASDKSTFHTLSCIDCSGQAKAKNGYTYLSWAAAVHHLLSHYPDATWEILRFDGLPFLKTDNGYFVEIAVTVNGITRSQLHPVLNHRNQPIQKPTCFDINNSCARALAKSIALHGLGLHIYQGEDIPLSEQEALSKAKETEDQLTRQLKQAEKNGDSDRVLEIAEQLRLLLADFPERVEKLEHYISSILSRIEQKV